MTHKERQDAALLLHAAADWVGNRAYLDGAGNYRVRPVAATPTHSPKGRVAPWNRTVKRTFRTCDRFHDAAHAAIRAMDVNSR